MTFTEGLGYFLEGFSHGARALAHGREAGHFAAPQLGYEHPQRRGGAPRVQWIAVAPQHLREFMQQFPSAAHSTLVLADLLETGREDLLEYAARQIAEVQKDSRECLVFAVAMG